MRKLLFILSLLSLVMACQKTEQDDLSVSVYIPNAFRPAGLEGSGGSSVNCIDGNPNCNSIFRIILSNPNTIPCKVRMNIYDTEGQNLYYSLDYYEGWNGQVRNGGKLCPQGNYRYVITVTEIIDNKTRIFEGDIALLR
jgi:hypothetical protein